MTTDRVVTGVADGPEVAVLHHTTGADERCDATTSSSRVVPPAPDDDLWARCARAAPGAPDRRLPRAAPRARRRREGERVGMRPVTGCTPLGERTWTDLDEPRTVVVPVGSLEQHGPHLPLDTDVRIAVAVADRVGRHRPDPLVAPPLAYGASGEHEGFPGTLSIGHEALRAAAGRAGAVQRRWAARLLFVNGHGGNLPTLPTPSRVAPRGPRRRLVRLRGPRR